MNILIAGGTGSFGHAFLTHLNEMRYKSKVRVFSRDEAKQIHLNTLYPHLQLEAMIGDIRDLDAYTQAAYKMDIVIHAAALKHVPVGELFTEEAIKTNTQGAINCVRACQTQGVKKAIYLSTDKAVYPINAYGMSKALGEKVFQSKNSQDCETVFCVTRYGNVLGSRGSILPLVKKLVSEKKKLKITDFSMTRFLMNLEQAVSLVSYAIDKGHDGQLFIQSVPAADLHTLLDAYLQFAFDTSLDDYGYEVMGIRPGEKIHEMLATAEELSRATFLSNEIICVEPYHQKELYKGYYNQAPKEHHQDLASNSVSLLSVDGVIQCLEQAALTF